MAFQNLVVVVPGITGSAMRDEYDVNPRTVWAMLLRHYDSIALHPDDARFERALPAREVIARTKLMRHYARAGFAEAPRVDLVAHSMGGLVVTGYLERRGRGARASRADRGLQARPRAARRGRLARDRRRRRGDARAAADPPGRRQAGIRHPRRGPGRAQAQGRPAADGADRRRHPALSRRARRVPAGRKARGDDDFGYWEFGDRLLEILDASA